MSDLVRMTPETIWHFTCDSCKNWWSISSIGSEWKPRKLFCPHCGHKHTYEYPSVESQLVDSGDYT